MSGDRHIDRGAESTHVALLRGINVGGRHRLRMKDLAAVFHDAGCDDVRTYIQSGNVVFRAPDALAGSIAEVVQDVVADRVGFRAPVVTRTADEMRRLPRRNPYLSAGADPGALHVVFLADEPDDADVANLDPGRSAPDEFEAIGREIFLRCPNGFGRTRLTNDYFDRMLRSTSTTRNWRTVLRLIEMVDGG